MVCAAENKTKIVSQKGRKEGGEEGGQECEGVWGVDRCDLHGLQFFATQGVGDLAYQSVQGLQWLWRIELVEQVVG